MSSSCLNYWEVHGGQVVFTDRLSRITQGQNTSLKVCISKLKTVRTHIGGSGSRDLMHGRTNTFVQVLVFIVIFASPLSAFALFSMALRSAVHVGKIIWHFGSKTMSHKKSMLTRLHLEELSFQMTTSGQVNDWPEGSSGTTPKHSQFRWERFLFPYRKAEWKTNSFFTTFH